MTLINLANERLIFLWNVIGPLLALATTLLMLLFPTPVTPLFALAMVCGLPLCWYVKKWGAISVTFALTFILFYNSHAVAMSPIWHIGMALSIALTLFITSHSFEEANAFFEEFSESPLTREKQNHELEELRLTKETELYNLQQKLEGINREFQVVQESKEQLQESVEKFQRELLLAKNEVQQAKNEAEQIRGELEAKAIKDEHVLQELLDKRREVFQLREQLQEVQNEQKDLSVSEPQNETELQNLRDLIGKKEQELFNIQFRLDSALEDIQSHQNDLSKLQTDELIGKKLQREMQDQIETLKRERELLELTIHKLQCELEQIPFFKQEKEKLEHSLQASLTEVEKLRSEIQNPKETVYTPIFEQDLTPESRQRRRIEGLYLQLKEQFSEKSEILDETRRELFRTQEQLFQIQQVLVESEKYKLNPQIQNLMQHILKMQKQFDQQEKSYQAEIDELNNLITRLSISLNGQN